MKTFLMLVLCAVSALAGYEVAEARNKRDAPPDEATVTLTMYKHGSAPVTREYQGIVSWAYNVVNGQGHMQLGFANPTVWRCGFEP